MTIHIDPSIDPAKDPRRAIFQEFSKSKDIEGLRKLIQHFIAQGHNPKDPTDGMFVILDITPEFLALTLFTLEQEAKNLQPVFTEVTEPAPPEIEAPEAIPEPEIQKA